MPRLELAAANEPKSAAIIILEIATASGLYLEVLSLVNLTLSCDP